MKPIITIKIRPPTFLERALSWIPGIGWMLVDWWLAQGRMKEAKNTIEGHLEERKKQGWTQDDDRAVKAYRLIAWACNFNAWHFIPEDRLAAIFYDFDDTEPTIKLISALKEKGIDVVLTQEEWESETVGFLTESIIRAKESK